MNAKQMSTWKEIVRLCKRRVYKRISVASETRSDAIVAANALVELVTLELTNLLERLAFCDLPNTFGDPYASRQCTRDHKAARALAARIREALEASSD